MIKPKSLKSVEKDFHKYWMIAVIGSKTIENYLEVEKKS